MTGHILCYTDFISILKDVCNENEIYNIVSRRLNWGRIQYDISPVIHLAPHDIAVLDYIFNKQEPSDITAKGYRFLAGSYPDYVVADLHYGDFNVQLQLGWYHSRKIRTITTTTSNGHYIWDDVKNTWQFISHYMEGKYQREDEFRNETIKGWSISTPLENEIMHFINCIKNSEQPLTNGEHSLRVTKIVDRIEECIKTY